MSVPSDTRTVHEQATSITVRAATIRVVQGHDAGLVARVEQPTFVIGTGDSADMRLTDPSVSREHLRITLVPNGVRLKDEGSKNGTLFGGSQVHDLTLVVNGLVNVGMTTLSISLESDPVDLALSASDRFGDAIGQSVVMRHLFATLERVASSELSVLLEGESGVGKDLLAAAIHARSARADGPFLVLDCGAIPPNLIESELFGHERGAFTGADSARRGIFQEAHGGTLFLDEIGELPLNMQPKLLGALEKKEVRPVGGKSSRAIDVRVLAATNRRLAEASRTGEFRSDLYYRLAVARVTVPPLRERAEDILPIALGILRGMKGPEASFPPSFAAMLTTYSWPGNVRELRNVVERFAVFGQAAGLFDQAEAVVRSADDELAQLPFQEARKIVLDRFEEAYIPRVVKRAGGVTARAAQLAGVARPSFYRMLERLRMSGREGSS